MNAPLDEVLDGLEHRLDSLEADLLEDHGFEPMQELPDEVSGTAADIERAHEVLERIVAVQARAEGMRLRLLGELAGLRRPTANGSSSFRVPRFLDVHA